MLRILVAAGLLCACGRSGEPTLLAAASLVDVVPEIYDSAEDVEVRASFAASSSPSIRSGRAP